MSTPKTSCSLRQFFGNNLNVEGGIFVFRGVPFFLYLEECGPPPNLAAIFMNGEDLGGSQAIFHQTCFNYKLGRFVSHKINFHWQ